ncbi:LPXTG cell wall anchor domain-containing protein [Microvirga lotononidis]|uniref:Uncharacterized protein n=1 Tax=Microvirga lotononidis TaxID=864069 RepID=I4YRD4_9HYPH|nr:LPXTG cell wall anchor domain-containing protein [Microvirga lotononidis]EIM26526.1 hypothetical protein MicloDRAFT_00030750 [Microvirga lotononidis]WQO31210.1 LPXTG cell wall anchor domain-containing protein [Microvirga lotononidis]
MSKYNPYSIYDPNSPYYDDPPVYPKVSGGTGWPILWVGGFAALFFWSYVAPVFYTLAYIGDFLLQLGNPRGVVEWQGDSSTYTIVVAGLTCVALLGGVYWLLRRVWRFVRSIRQGY